MHAVCPAMLGPLAFNLKKTSISMWPLIAGLYAAAHSHCC